MLIDPCINIGKFTADSKTGCTIIVSVLFPIIVNSPSKRVSGGKSTLARCPYNNVLALILYG